MNILGYQYFTPDEGAFFIPVVMAEADGLHVEYRYNYEDFATTSLWMGPIFTWEGDVAVNVTPLLGVAIGRTIGIGPGFEASLDWTFLHMYAEGQLLLDLRVPDESYTYVWADLTADIAPWLEVGLVAQRTRYLGHADDLSAGPLVGTTIGPLNIRAHLLGVGTEYRYGIITFDLPL